MLASPPSVSSPLDLHQQDVASLYSPDKMMSPKTGVSSTNGAPGTFHSGRYSPTFRSPDPRRCNAQVCQYYHVFTKFTIIYFLLQVDITIYSKLIN